jgi:hypothetical protein
VASNRFRARERSAALAALPRAAADHVDAHVRVASINDQEVVMKR